MSVAGISVIRRREVPPAYDVNRWLPKGATITTDKLPGGLFRFMVSAVGIAPVASRVAFASKHLAKQYGRKALRRAAYLGIQSAWTPRQMHGWIPGNDRMICGAAFIQGGDKPIRKINHVCRKCDEILQPLITEFGWETEGAEDAV